MFPEVKVKTAKEKLSDYLGHNILELYNFTLEKFPFITSKAALDI